VPAEQQQVSHLVVRLHAGGVPDAGVRLRGEVLDGEAELADALLCSDGHGYCSPRR